MTTCAHTLEKSLQVQHLRLRCCAIAKPEIPHADLEWKHIFIAVGCFAFCPVGEITFSLVKNLHVQNLPHWLLVIVTLKSQT